MKLTQQYIRFYIYLSVFVFIISLVVSYFGFKMVVIRNIDLSLSDERKELVDEFRKGVYTQKHGDLVDIELVNDMPKNLKDIYKTVDVYDKDLKRVVRFRELDSYFYKGKLLHRLKIKLHLGPHLNNIFTIFPYFLASFAFFVGCFYVVNGFFLKKTFFPFYQILNSLKVYDIQRGDYEPDINTNIYEFKELNEIAHNLTDRVHKDYKIQKEFIENSSHEFKTPLAIINNHLDMLIQSENLTEQEMQHISHIYDSVKRLTNLNKNLTFLFKIENQHFTDNNWVFISPVLERIITANADLYVDKDMLVSKYIGGEINIKMNETLLEVLLNNIINNAFKYGVADSNISIRLTNSSLEVTNKGQAGQLKDINMFNRFVTSGDMNSTGLGLSIVKKICDLYKMEITCTVFEDMFSVFVEFPIMEPVDFE